MIDNEKCIQRSGYLIPADVNKWPSWIMFIRKCSRVGAAEIIDNQQRIERCYGAVLVDINSVDRIPPINGEQATFFEGFNH